MQQPAVTMLPQHLTPTEQPGTRVGFAHATVRSFGITQITLGSLAMIFFIAAIVIDCGSNTGVNYVGAGIWTGILFIVTGVLACISGSKKNNCTIIATMVLSIISAVAAGAALLTMSALAIALEDDCYYDYGRRYGDWYCDTTRYNSCIALSSISLIISIIVGVIAILTACFCCRAVCCNQSPPRAMYFMAAGQPVNTPVQFPAANMASPQGAPVYMMPSTGLQVMSSTSGVQQYQPMTVAGYPQQTMYIPQQQPPPQQQQQPALMTVQQRQVPQQTPAVPIPQPQQQAAPQRVNLPALAQQQPPTLQAPKPDQQAVSSSPPPSYSSTEGNVHPSESMTVPLVSQEHA